MGLFSVSYFLSDRDWNLINLLIDITKEAKKKMFLAINGAHEEHQWINSFQVFLYFFALIVEEGFLSSPCYFWELCILMGLSFLFYFAFSFSSFHSYLYGFLRQPFCFLHFSFLGMVLDHRLFFVQCLEPCPKFFKHSIRSNPLNLFLTSTVQSLMFNDWNVNVNHSNV